MNKKICVVYTHHQLPYIKAISEHHSQNVDLILREKTQAKNILKDITHINFISYNNFRKLLADVFKLLKIFLKKKYSHVYILDKVNKPAIAANLSGIKNIIGPGIGNQKKWLTVDKVLNDTDKNLSYSEQSQKMLKINNIKLNNLYPELDRP